MKACGRNIKPRHSEEDLYSPPTNKTLSDIETNYIKVLETCLNSNEKIDSYNDGGVFYKQHHNFAIYIPPGAVSQGDCVEIQAKASLFGPYKIPHGFYPISSYFWIRADYRFKTPVFLIMDHYAKIRSLDDVNSLHAFQTHPNNSSETEILHMSAISDGVYFDIETGYCVLATDYFCSYCLAKSVKHIPDRFLACYYTYDDPISQSYIVEVCFCPSNAGYREVICIGVECFILMTTHNYSTE